MVPTCVCVCVCVFMWVGICVCVCVCVCDGRCERVDTMVVSNQCDDFMFQRVNVSCFSLSYIPI